MNKASVICVVLVLAVAIAYGDPGLISDSLTGYTGANADGTSESSGFN